MDRQNRAVALHAKKYNCAQSTICAFADKVDVDARTLFRMSEAFGLGTGDTNGTCGALSGALMLAGLCNSDGNLEQPQTKKSTYALATKMRERFVELVGSTVCRDIKGLESGSPLCSCDDCVRFGVQIGEEFLLSEPE